MIIKNLELKDFRNYESLNLKFHNKVNIFLGDNAQGKTNILEAIYISSLGKSFRTRDDSDMIRFGSEFAKVRVDAEKDDEDLCVELIFTDKGKGVKVDGVKIRRTAELLENIYAVVFSPEDLKIVKEDPERRRKFIDTEISRISATYFSRLSDYKRIIKQRNAFLKDSKFTNGRCDVAILDIWDEQLAGYGAEVILRRNEFIKKLNVISKKLHSGITGGKEDIEIVYEPNVEVCDNLNEQRELFKKSLAASRQKDLASGTTGIGPHRDDIAILVNGIDIRKFGSQGQQRTSALSLKLAELRLIKEETGENAILLLDDVMSELDASRQNFLVNSLGDVQLFITTTDLGDDVKAALPEGKTFYVNSGTALEK